MGTTHRNGSRPSGPPEIGETVYSDGERELTVVPTDKSTIEGWDVESDPDGTTSTKHIRDELERHLPAGWEITTFDPWSPHRTNHGGSIHYQVHIEHTSGAELQLRPASTWPEDTTKTVYNSHKLTKIGFDGSREKLLSADILKQLSIPASIFKPLIDAVESHQPQQTIGDYD